MNKLIYRINRNRTLNRNARNISSWTVFLSAAFIYILTADRHASFWDCPEYVTCASLLEVGHPPGNPIWMLAMRTATIFFPTHLHAFVINICSALLMAFAAFFLARIIYDLTLRVTTTLPDAVQTNIPLLPAVAALCGGCCFAFCDSAWFSAAEAEVYAMSAFLMSLTIWLMMRCASATDRCARARILILVAYLTGLSLGVHQLNLLCIPVYALIYVFGRHPNPGAGRRGWVALFLSLMALGVILVGLTAGTVHLASVLELLAVNRFGLPYHTGAICAPAAILIIIAALLGIFSRWGGKRRLPLLTATWMAGFLFLGTLSFCVIIIRGYASPPMNEGAPSDIFSLASYMGREQYGSKPLIYGETPYSIPLLEEHFTPGKAMPEYSRYILKKGKPVIVPVMDEPRLNHRSNMLSADDSAANKAILSGGTNGYLLADYSFSRMMTPELDMWLPRMTGHSPSDLASYEDWTGMNRDNMERVAVSETMDSLGNPVGKMLPDGTRSDRSSFRPTYLQNLKMFLTYQAGYMYFRYLLWNFAGRQNDMPSSGEIEHGNFITGFRAIDNAMLGNQALIPGEHYQIIDNIYTGNKGRNVYYCLPLLFGLIGIWFLARSGREGRRVLAVTAVFFLMTGLAIVAYLNQDPGEPRERDYSFLGSFMAFSIWIGFTPVAFGVLLAKVSAKKLCNNILTLGLASVPALLMLSENFDDHDRRGRGEPEIFAGNILGTPRPAIIFSQGDNNTFPLWYAQEVLGIGTRHTVVDLSYLSTPEYAVNLMKQGERGLHLMARPADIAYGAYAFSRVASDADTVPVPLAHALKELYSSREGAPMWRHCKVTIPGRTMADTLIIDLRELNQGSSLMPFRQLMILDIIASNMAQPNPRPVYFLNSIQYSFHKPLAPATRQSVYARVYDPSVPDSLFRDVISKDLETPIANAPRLRGERYADPEIKRHRRAQRGAMLIAAKELLERGDTAGMWNALNIIHSTYNYHTLPAGSFTLADTTFYESAEYGRLLLDFYNSTKNDTALSLLINWGRGAQSQLAGWNSYYQSLSPSQRETVSDETLRIIWGGNLSKPTAERGKAIADSIEHARMIKYRQEKMARRREWRRPL